MNRQPITHIALFLGLFGAASASANDRTAMSEPAPLLITRSQEAGELKESLVGLSDFLKNCVETEEVGGLDGTAAVLIERYTKCGYKAGLTTDKVEQLLDLLGLAQAQLLQAPDGLDPLVRARLSATLGLMEAEAIGLL